MHFFLYTYYLANGYDPKYALQLANYAGAISVSRIGTRNSIPTKEEMEVPVIIIKK